MNHQYNLDPERGWNWPIRIESLDNGIPSPAAGDENAEATPTSSLSHSYAQTKELTRKEKLVLVILMRYIILKIK